MNNNKMPQLFLFHYAGGNIYSFNFLKKYLDPYFEVISLELPGRGKRMSEDLIKDRELAVQDQFNEIIKYRKKGSKYALYGHSMGAIVGFELVKLLNKNEDSPVALIVSGNPGPGEFRDQVRYNLNGEDFILALKELGGIPNEVYETKELFDFFEPILRADFEIVERSIKELSGEINCPIYCAMGSKEKYVDKISNWQNFTKKNFEYKIFEGGHFFINYHPEQLVHFIKKAYNESLVF